MDRRGISPVIATVIIVAVAIAIAIAVAFWLTGIVGLFTGFEQVQIVSAYAEISGSNFVIHIKLKNTGTSPATIDEIFINGQPISDALGTTFTLGGDVSSLPYTLNPGSDAEMTITFAIDSTWAGGTLTHGTSVEIKVHTASGKEYPKLVVLP